MAYPLIRLFPANATSFYTNGLGSLIEATSCTITEERNGSFELEMTYPVTGRHFNDIQLRSLIVAKPSPARDPQAFRIYEFTKPMDGMVTFRAEHVSYDLAKCVVKPFKATSCINAFTTLKANFAAGTLVNNFSFNTDISKSGNLNIETPMSVRAVLGGTEGSILDLFGGEYEFDNFHVYLHSARGWYTNSVIRYGKNLTDIKQESSIASVYTKILPYWAGEVDEVFTVVMLPEVTLSALSSGQSYDFESVMVVDFSSEFQEKPFVTDLRAKAKEWITANKPATPTVSFDVSYMQLEQSEEYENLAVFERVELCDQVIVEFERYGISAEAKVTKTVYDPLAQRYTSVTLGDIRSKLSDTMIDQSDALDKVAADSRNNLSNASSDITSKLQAAIENATKWITSGGGYIVAVKNNAGQWTEICSLNTPNIATATKVWRWNNGGFGFSSRGYNGPYTLALTADGAINASMITTGTLTANLITAGTMTANRIKGGTLTLGGSGGSYGSLVILDSYGGTAASMTYSGVNVYSGTITGTSFEAVTPYSYAQKTRVYITDSDIKFYHGHLTGVVNNSYAGYVGPIDYYGNPVFYYNGELLYDVQDGYYPGLMLFAQIVMDIYAGGQRQATIDHNGFRFHQGFIVDGIATCDGVVTDNIKATTGNFTNLFVKGSPVYGDIVVGVGDPSEDGPSVTTVALDYGYALTSPMIGDVGSGQTDEEGLCYVYLDDYAASGINTSVEYYVFLQKEGPGDIWIKDKASRYFVVEGTPDLKFSWELKGKKPGFEYERTENKDAITPEYEDQENKLLDEAIETMSRSVNDGITYQVEEMVTAIRDRGGDV